MSQEKLRKEVNDVLTKLGAFKVGVADPQKGFAQALDGCHPKDLMKTCRSVIVYAFNIGLDYYTALDYEHNNIRLGHLYRDWTGLQLITFLRKKGYDAAEVPRGYVDEKNRIAPMSYKLAAYEAGIGVFGRPSIILTPEYGPRINIGAVLTNALLKPDKRTENFSPCEHCNVCTAVCPVNAIRRDVPPPKGYDRNKCVGFVDWLKEKTNDQVKLCGVCFNKCPAGKLAPKTLAIGRWTTLDDLKTEDKKKLTAQFTATQA
jgi:epoxyqueuosine reductase QueG